MTNLVKLGGNNTPPANHSGLTAPEENEELLAPSNKKELGMDNIYPLIVKIYAQMAERIAASARRADILPERDIESLLNDYVALTHTGAFNKNWDITHKLIQMASLGQDSKENKTQRILDRICAHYTRPMHVAPIDAPVGGTYSALSDEKTAWKTTLCCGSVILNYNRPGIFTLGSFSPWHLEGTKMMLTKVWMHQNEHQPKPFISGFVLPYNKWEALQQEQWQAAHAN